MRHSTAPPWRIGAAANEVTSVYVGWSEVTASSQIGPRVESARACVALPVASTKRARVPCAAAKLVSMLGAWVVRMRCPDTIGVTRTS